MLNWAGILGKLHFYLGIIFFLGLLLPGQSIGQRDADVIKFGVSLDLSGSFRVMSSMQKKGFRLWESHVNASGGILGKEVQIIIQDNQGSIETLQKHYLEMLEDKAVDFVFAPYSSAHNHAVVQLFEQYKIPVVTSGASDPSLWEQGYRYFFGLYSPADKYAQGFLEIMSLRNIRRTAVFYLGDPFSSSAGEGAVKWARRLGMEVRVFEQVDSDYESFLQAVKRARNEDVESLIMCGYLEASIFMRRAIAESDWSPDAYFATVGPVSQDYYDSLEGKGENTFSSAIWQYHSQLVFPGIHRFNAEFIDRFGHEPNYHAASAYAAGQLMEKAMNLTGGFRSDDLREALLQMETFTIIGRYGVNDNGKQIRQIPFTIQWQQGRMEIVWPQSLATSSPRLEYGRR